MLQGDSRPVFFTKTWMPDSDDRVTLSAWQADADGEIRSGWEVDGLPGSTELLTRDSQPGVPDVAALVRVEIPANTVIGIYTGKAIKRKENGKSKTAPPSDYAIEYNDEYDLPDDVKDLGDEAIDGIKDGSISTS